MSFALQLSAEQLDELWHLDFYYAAHLLGFPNVRRCSAKPSDSWGTKMTDAEFDNLKEKVRYMWVSASCFFNPKDEGDMGWGLVASINKSTQLSLPQTSFTYLGWVARAPLPSECGTGHRYLRSPIDKSCYLGGPISLANWSSKPTVKCNVTKHYLMQVTTIGRVPQGTAILWTYNISLAKDKLPNFTPKSEWELELCCTECSTEEPPSKKLKTYRASRPRKISSKLESFRFCTFCGMNLETNEVKKKNIKTHWAVKHAVQVVEDSGNHYDDEFSGMVEKDFKKYLHVVDLVLDALKSHGYVARPACHIFQILGKEPVDQDCPEKKEEFFKKFQVEAMKAYNAYQVIFLRGIKLPSNYEELIPVPTTNYKDVHWEEGRRPMSNSFSVEKLLSQDEAECVSMDIEVKIKDIVQKCNEWNFEMD